MVVLEISACPEVVNTFKWQGPKISNVGEDLSGQFMTIIYCTAAISRVEVSEEKRFGRLPDQKHLIEDRHVGGRHAGGLCQSIGAQDVAWRWSVQVTVDDWERIALTDNAVLMFETM